MGGAGRATTEPVWIEWWLSSSGALRSLHDPVRGKGVGGMGGGGGDSLVNCGCAGMVKSMIEPLTPVADYKGDFVDS